MMKHETDACTHLAHRAANGERLVVATGGGISDNDDALAILKTSGTIIWLDVPFDTLFSRVLRSADRDGRLPRFLEGGNPRDKFYELFVRRTAIYAKIANVAVATGALSPEKIADFIIERIPNGKRTHFHCRRRTHYRY
jgi:shikimate kinase